MHEPYEKPLAIIWSGTEKELLTEVEVSCSQVIQRILKGFLCGSLVEVIELSRKKDALAGDTRGLDALADFLFVGVGSGSIDVLISVLQSKLYGVLNGTGLGFPCTYKHNNQWSAFLHENSITYPARP